MSRISIIVPVYNTEQYLPRCIDSILSQSFTDFELLLIDDGSSDGSGQICDAYAEKDNRIRVFHKENGGVSSARNLGLDNAVGEWIYFVDSDDELLPDGLQVLFDNTSKEVDVVLAGFVEVSEEGVMSPGVKDKIVLRLNKKQSLMSVYQGYGFYYFYLGYMCLRMFRNIIIKQRKLRFDNNIAVKEDTLFTVQYLCKSNGVTQMTTIPVYKYWLREDSAMGKTRHGFDHGFVDSFYAMVNMKREIESVFPRWNECVFVAKQGVYGRCFDVIQKMERYDIQDDRLKARLVKDMHNEVGSVFAFKMRRKCRKILRYLGLKKQNYNV